MDDFIKKRIEAFCQENRARLLFCTLFGSDLYGTRIEGKSDLDLRGIFLPDADAMLLGRKIKSLHFSTGEDHVKNSSDDVDLELWSLQYWLLELLPGGDTNALDLLYAPSNKACAIYCDPAMKGIFDNAARFVNLAGATGYAGYSLGQAKKYGIKGSRLGVIRQIHDYLAENCPEPEKWDKLKNWHKRIVSLIGASPYCKEVVSNNVEALEICGKIHQDNISMTEFNRRINEEYGRYGQRARDAQQNLGLDYKALSHAVRALEQIRELTTTGKIQYPLSCAEELIRVKQGAYGWKELEPMILNKLELAMELVASSDKFGAYDLAYAENFILNLYRRSHV